MPNIAGVLRDEIRRLAKKEVKAQVGSTKQAVAKYRSDIARLKRGLSQHFGHFAPPSPSGTPRRSSF